MSTSVFSSSKDKLFARYSVRLEFRDRLMGGVPKDPKLIEGWLRSKAGVTDEEELRQATIRTLRELGVEIDTGASFDEMRQASEQVASDLKTNGFKSNGHGLYIEERQIKAMLKESVNVIFAGAKWGTTRKGPRNYTAERVFVAEPSAVLLGKNEPDGVELFLGHVSDASGRRSTLTYYEYVVQPTLEFEVMVVEDGISEDQWAFIWVHAEENGLGALRSQGFGRFDVTRWERQAA